MKRFLSSLIFAIGLLSLPSLAQQNYNFNVGGLGYASGASVPASCSRDGSWFWLNTGSKSWYVCSNGTYSAVGGGAGGTITGVTAGTGLNGGGSSGTVTLNLNSPVVPANGGTGSVTIPTSGQVPVGNAGNTAYAPITISQDCTLTSAGVLTCTKTNNVAFTGLATASIPLSPANGGTGVINTGTLTLGSSNQNWATLGTGIVKNTTTTGALSNANSADILGLCVTCVTSGASLTSTAFMTGAGGQGSQTPSATSTLDASGNGIFAGSVTVNGAGAALTQTEIADPGLPGANKGALYANSSYHRWMIDNNNVGPKAVATWGVTSAGGLQVGGSSAINGINTEVLVAGNASGLGIGTENSSGVWGWVAATNASGTLIQTASGAQTSNALLKYNATGDAVVGNLSETTTQLTESGTSGLLLNGVGEQLISTQGSIALSAPFISHTGTWNAGGVTFHNFTSNVTNTASANGSTLFEFQVGGNNEVALDRNGTTASYDTLTIGNVTNVEAGKLVLTGSTGGSCNLFANAAGNTMTSGCTFSAGSGLSVTGNVTKLKNIATVGATGAVGTFGIISTTGNTAAITTATLCAAASCGNGTAGQFNIDAYLDSTVTCATPGPAVVGITLTWTDEIGTKSAQTLPLDVNGANALTSTMALGNTTNFASGHTSIWTTGTIIQYATTYTACTSGTGTYAIRIAVTQVQ